MNALCLVWETQWTFLPIQQSRNPHRFPFFDLYSSKVSSLWLGLFCCSDSAQSKCCAISSPKIDDTQLQLLIAEQQTLAKQQQALMKSHFSKYLTRVCLPLDCSIEELSAQTTDSPPLESESIRIVMDIGLYNVPILLDVLRAHPYQLSWMVLRSTMEKPCRSSQDSSSFSRTVLPKEIAEAGVGVDSRVG